MARRCRCIRRVRISIAAGHDSPSVDQFRATNPFDAVSQPTPFGGLSSTAVWSAPQSVDYGDYVLFVETSKTYDFNADYNATKYPSPNDIPWKEYGQAWRGQPSVVYSVPITIASTPTRATSMAYVGYGDPDGKDGTLNPPDATITTSTPGSGGSRLELVSDAPRCIACACVRRPSSMRHRPIKSARSKRRHHGLGRHADVLRAR